MHLAFPPLEFSPITFSSWNVFSSALLWLYTPLGFYPSFWSLLSSLGAFSLPLDNFQTPIVGCLSFACSILMVLSILWLSVASMYSVQFSSVQSLSRVQLFVTPWIAARQASLSITNSQSSFRLTSIESVMPSSHLILCCPLLLLPPIPPSIRVFSSESTLHMRWPKYWSFSFSLIPSKEIRELISFRMDWLDWWLPNLYFQPRSHSYLSVRSFQSSSGHLLICPGDVPKSACIIEFIIPLTEQVTTFSNPLPIRTLDMWQQHPHTCLNQKPKHHPLLVLSLSIIPSLQSPCLIDPKT